MYVSVYQFVCVFVNINCMCEFRIFHTLITCWPYSKTQKSILALNLIINQTFNLFLNVFVNRDHNSSWEYKFTGNLLENIELNLNKIKFT